MSHVLNTQTVVPHERVPYWIDMISSTYVPLECEPLAAAGFSGSIHSHQLPGLDFSVICSGAQKVRRTARDISRASEAFCIVSLQTRGRGVVSQDGREALLCPGDMVLYESTRPYALNFSEDFEEIVLRLRAEQLRSMVRHTERLTATTISGQSGAGMLLAGMVRGICEQIGSLGAASTTAVVGGVLNLLVAGLQSLPAGEAVEPSSLEAYHLARIRQAIDLRMRDPALTIESVAGELGMSIGHLHRLFKREPLSPAQYLWSRRLDACSRALADPQRGKTPVAQIAFNWGFNDAAHFSRAFRDRFGCSPTEWRRNAVAAAGSSPQPRMFQ